jgi:sulfur carrier protein ThiS
MTTENENGTIKVNVGTPGNVRAITLNAGHLWTVDEVLAAAELSSEGYDMRLTGEPVTGSSLVSEGQTLLLLAPVRGNFDDGASIKINAGTPGNIGTVTIEGAFATVGNVLKQAELSADGYDIRVNGQPAKLDTMVTDGQTVLLLAPVRGN